MALAGAPFMYGTRVEAFKRQYVGPLTAHSSCSILDKLKKPLVHSVGTESSKMLDWTLRILSDMWIGCPLDRYDVGRDKECGDGLGTGRRDEYDDVNANNIEDGRGVMKQRRYQENPIGIGLQGEKYNGE